MIKCSCKIKKGIATSHRRQKVRCMTPLVILNEVTGASARFCYDPFAFLGLQYSSRGSCYVWRTYSIIRSKCRYLLEWLITVIFYWETKSLWYNEPVWLKRKDILPVISWENDVIHVRVMSLHFSFCCYSVISQSCAIHIIVLSSQSFNNSLLLA